MRNPLPQHIAIIMDGNRTWAKNNDISTIKGHDKGLDVAREICIYCNHIGVKNLTLYAFSVQNWTRPKVEIDALFSLFIDFFDNKSDFFHQHKLKFNPIGRIDKLPPAIIKKVNKLKKETHENLGSCINVAINYGGREEMVDTTRKIIEDVISVNSNAEQNKKLESINEEVIKNNSYLPVIPEPELLIRTGGHSRGSNFLLWHIAYSEIDICNKLWPDFNSNDLEESINKYKCVDRKFGGSSKND